MKKTWLFLALVLTILTGIGFNFAYNRGKCLANGGGYTYEPPMFVEKVRPSTLTLRLNAWGNSQCIKPVYWQDGKPAKLFTQVQCHFRLAGETEYKSAPMRLTENTVSDASYTATYVCDIPPLFTDHTPHFLEYYFDYVWGDAYHRHDQKPLPVSLK
jgi:hypothetical protein